MHSAGQFYAFDTAPKSRMLLGGGVNYMANLTFINDNPGVMQLASWTWGQQGVYVDTDGSFFKPGIVPQAFLDHATAKGWKQVGGKFVDTTFHSAIDNQIFDENECLYVLNATTTNAGVFCDGNLRFKRVMLKGAAPSSLKSQDLLITSLSPPSFNRSAFVFSAS